MLIGYDWGDKNIAFFHRFASIYWRMNIICRLESEDETKVCNEEIGRIATRFFQHLFLSNQIGDLSHILTRINESISLDISLSLMARYMEEKVYTQL